MIGLTYFTLGFILIAALVCFLGDKCCEFLFGFAWDLRLIWFLSTPARKNLLIVLVSAVFYLLWLPVTVGLGFFMIWVGIEGTQAFNSEDPPVSDLDPTPENLVPPERLPSALQLYTGIQQHSPYLH